LTFKGLIYALSQDFVEPKAAYKVRVEHKIQLPLSKVSPPIKTFTEVIERNFPEIFYALYSEFGNDLRICKFPSELSATVSGLIPAVLALFGLSLISRHPECNLRFVKGNDFHFPDGYVAKDFTKYPLFMDRIFKITDSKYNLTYFTKYIKIDGDRVFWEATTGSTPYSPNQIVRCDPQPPSKGECSYCGKKDEPLTYQITTDTKEKYKVCGSCGKDIMETLL